MEVVWVDWLRVCLANAECRVQSADCRPRTKDQGPQRELTGGMQSSELSEGAKERDSAELG